jgi:hypothetical protein
VASATGYLAKVEDDLEYIIERYEDWASDPLP